MTRPNRYPYTKSQWKEIELQEKQNDLCFDIIGHHRITYRYYLVNWFYWCNHRGSLKQKGQA